jgi:large-conductance mechanosensitive channel
MSLKLAKAPLIAAFIVLLIAGLAFASKSFAPEFSLVGLSMGEFGDLIAIALGVFALMLAALSFVMAKPVPKAAKKKEKKSKKKDSEGSGDALDMLDDEPETEQEEDSDSQIDPKAQAKIDKKQAAKDKKAAKEAAAQKKKEEKEAAKQAAQDAKKADKANNSSEDEEELVELIDDEIQPDSEFSSESEVELSNDDTNSSEEPEAVNAMEDDSVEEEFSVEEDIALTEAEMLEEAGPEKKKLTPAEKKAAKAAKREAAKKAKLDAKFQKQAEKEAEKAAKAAKKASKKGLEADNSYDMLEDGEILPDGDKSVTGEIPAPVSAVESVSTESAPSITEGDTEDLAEQNEEVSTEVEEANPEIDAAVDAEIDAAYAELTEEGQPDSSVEEEATEEEAIHAFTPPQPAVDPSWATDAFSDDRFVIPFSGQQNSNEERVEALMARMETILEKLESDNKENADADSNSK